MKFLLISLCICVAVPGWCKALPLQQETIPANSDGSSGRQIQSILDIPQQVASFIGNTLFPTTVASTTRRTRTAPTKVPRNRNSTTTEAVLSKGEVNEEQVVQVQVTPRIKYVYVTPPAPRVVIVKPRPFAPAVGANPVAVATEAAEVTTEAPDTVEGGDEDEDTEEEGQAAK